MLVILDGGDRRLAFSKPQAIISANTAQEVPDALAAMSAARAEGWWLSGWFAYELGFALEPRLAYLSPAVEFPLLTFGLFDAPHDPDEDVGRAYVGRMQPEWSAADYAGPFAVVKEALAAGDIYQANLSLRAHFPFFGDPRGLYEQLRANSAAPYCAYLDDGIRQIVSLSPELFFEIEQGMIVARPMKGTAPRLGHDETERAALAASPKDRAENLMIVDLLRNDLGRIAEIGSVAVPKLFAVETYPTLHTMVSTVTARLRKDADIPDILAALFPCGSITGAPKIRAMEILRDLEASPRGTYCGAIGFFAPKVDGRARFNVAIRTLTIRGQVGEVGVGGGIVQDSECESEYAECLLKARFLTDAHRPIELIETVRYDRVFVRLSRHLKRMEGSARAFGLAFSASLAQEALTQAVAGWDGPLRVRLTLDEDGHHRATAAALRIDPVCWVYAVAPGRTRSGDPFLRHKTNWREVLQEGLVRPPLDELVLVNERGELTEGSRSNIFVKYGSRLVTPPVTSGLLPGCLRAELLESGVCQEGPLTEADLGGEVYFGNSLRGLVLGKRHGDFGLCG
ncbi:MAG: aminodeoxychorismate synthase component I [Acidiphilium sp.]|nr:aminodeoxychorismate synthase component I [Acidiphilium sp.]MDD4937032.1 aminodeoxychorismate synthase component I [Acidiphilium sp.]